MTIRRQARALANSLADSRRSEWDGQRPVPRERDHARCPGAPRHPDARPRIESQRVRSGDRRQRDRAGPADDRESRRPPAGPRRTPAGLVASPARQRELLDEIKAKRVQAPAPGAPGIASRNPRVARRAQISRRMAYNDRVKTRSEMELDYIQANMWWNLSHATRAESLATAHGFGNRIWMAGLWLWRPEPPLSCLWPGWPRLCSDEWLLNQCKTTPSQ